MVAALEALPFFPAAGECRDRAWARLEGHVSAVSVSTGADTHKAAGGGASLSVKAPDVFATLGLPSRTLPGVPDIEDVDAIHEAACRKGEYFYTDPATGYMVMTKLKHQARAKCCGSGCRHCPFAHANVRDKSKRIQMPALLHAPSSVASEVIVLFWSGGKDSFLALRAMLKPSGLLHGVGPAGVVLLTTFDAATRMIAHQASTSVLGHLVHLGLLGFWVLLLSLALKFTV